MSCTPCPILARTRVLDVLHAMPHLSSLAPAPPVPLAERTCVRARVCVRASVRVRARVCAGACAYACGADNEVVINAETYAAKLPTVVEAIFFPTNAPGAERRGPIPRRLGCNLCARHEIGPDDPRPAMNAPGSVFGHGHGRPSSLPAAHPADARSSPRVAVHHREGDANGARAAHALFLQRYDLTAERLPLLAFDVGRARNGQPPFRDPVP